MRLRNDSSSLSPYISDNGRRAPSYHGPPNYSTTVSSVIRNLNGMQRNDEFDEAVDIESTDPREISTSIAIRGRSVTPIYQNNSDTTDTVRGRRTLSPETNSNLRNSRVANRNNSSFIDNQSEFKVPWRPGNLNYFQIKMKKKNNEKLGKKQFEGNLKLSERLAFDRRYRRRNPSNQRRSSTTNLDSLNSSDVPTFIFSTDEDSEEGIDASMEEEPGNDYQDGFSTLPRGLRALGRDNPGNVERFLLDPNNNRISSQNIENSDSLGTGEMQGLSIGSRLQEMARFSANRASSGPREQSERMSQIFERLSSTIRERHLMRMRSREREPLILSRSNQDFDVPNAHEHDTISSRLPSQMIHSFLSARFINEPVDLNGNLSQDRFGGLDDGLFHEAERSNLGTEGESDALGFDHDSQAYPRTRRYLNLRRFMSDSEEVNNGFGMSNHEIPEPQSTELSNEAEIFENSNSSRERARRLIEMILGFDRDRDNMSNL